MGAQSVFTFDLAPPRRPSLDDLGGAAKANAADADPPDPVRDPTAEEHNQFAQLLAYSGRALPTAVISVSLVALAPSIASFQAAPTAMVVGSFSVIVESTHKVITISWTKLAAGPTLPPSVNQPTLTMSQAIVPGSSGAVPFAVNGVDSSGNPGVIITLPVAYTALANGPLFQVSVY